MAESELAAYSDPVLIKRLKSLSMIFGSIILLVGLVVIFGWALDIVVLKSVHPSFVTMKANTAIGFVLAGLALLLLQTAPKTKSVGIRLRLAQICSCLVALIGAITLGEYIFSWNPGFDQLFFREGAEAVFTFSPGRMAVNTSLCFFLTGLALLLIDIEDGHGRRPSQYLILGEGLLALLAVIGYLYGTKAFYGFLIYTKMAVHTAVLFSLAFFAVLFARPCRGFMRLATASSVGGFVFRRLLISSTIGLFLLGWLRVQGERAGLYDSTFGASAYALISAIFLSGLLWLTSSLLHTQDLRRIEYEAALQKAKEAAESASRLKELLLDILRHDLLGPAGVVKSSLDMVLLKEMPPENKLKFLQLAEGSINKMIEMIESAKIYAKVEGAESLPKESADLNEIFQIVADSFRTMLLERKIVLNYLPQREKRATVNPMIENVFANLVSNAIKYSPEGSKIEVDIVDKGPNWLIYVKDWGDGIADANKAALFTRFKRVDKKGVKGTGLGLAIVKRIVELHAGQVWIENNPEGGSIFYVEVPKI
jgi:signal transduction histidine kinase